MTTKVPRPLYAYGISLRKRGLVRDFSGRADVRFVHRGSAVPPDADLLLWGSTPLPRGLRGSVHAIRLEDGFLRSVGLGADLVRPISWVLDGRGIYYDPREPSDLEVLLQANGFSPGMQARARSLRTTIVEHGLSKYNLGGAVWWRPGGTRQVVLVVGQVESDASIACGCLDIRTNAALLQAVRQARPDAWLVYKPHPDVVAGLRRSGQQDKLADQWADAVLVSGSPAQILSQVDEVHVMTSLLGFEALLRGVPVHCHGLPFYAGWGLTQDRHPHPRRTRRLALDELVAGALLVYPRYVSLHTRQHCSAEQAVEELLHRRSRLPLEVPWWRKWIRPMLSRR